MAHRYVYAYLENVNEIFECIKHPPNYACKQRRGGFDD
jgi:hypothetical protein